MTRDRIREIGEMMLDSQGGIFPCHRSVDYSDYDDENEEIAPGEQEVHCAGALIWAEKHDTATQMMRIAERLGHYDRTKLAGGDLVWDSLEQWLATVRRGRRQD